MIDPILHQVFSVSQSIEPGALILSVDITDIHGERYTCNYCSRADDTFGLNPTIRQWLDDNAGGYVVAPYVPPTVEEQRASMPVLSARRLRLGLINNGIMPSQVQAALEAMPAGVDREKALVEWEFASDFERNHHLILSVGAALGLTAAQIDTMWMASQTL
jgi:hypothetical protein